MGTSRNAEPDRWTTFSILVAALDFALKHILTYLNYMSSRALPLPTGRSTRVICPLLALEICNYERSIERSSLMAARASRNRGAAEQIGLLDAKDTIKQGCVDYSVLRQLYASSTPHRQVLAVTVIRLNSLSTALPIS
ncbi:hypothetical protein RRG08_035359 [Elysia crispata]|uniref:Uncharacterized protein n=1 Tax=Elysia crispata TaxID=231223 RepID=A0AAE0Y4C5_9GAST|nr:hypothetical protein RRG08_035359 [Elysia crispata]